MQNEELILKELVQFATLAHAGQQRKFANEPYIDHVMRVMQQCRLYDKSLVLAAGALLHDVLEDTKVTSAEMLDFLEKLMGEKGEDVYALVVELTDVYTKKAYPNLNKSERKIREHGRLASTSAQAHTIKYADIIDNSRDKGIPANKDAFTYLKRFERLLMLIPNGNATLYSLAKHEVQSALKKLPVQTKTFT